MSGAMFVCQKCHRPLRIESEQGIQGTRHTLQATVQTLSAAVRCLTACLTVYSIALAESTLLAFRGSFTTDEETKQRDTRLVDQLADSFLLVQSARQQQPTNQSQSRPTATQWDRQIETLTAIFEAASDKCAFEHPFCSSCSDSVREELDNKLSELEQDKRAYTSALAQLQAAQPVDESGREAEEAAEEEEMRRKEEQLMARLRGLQQERLALEYESQQLDDQTATLAQFEASYHTQYQQFLLQYATMQKQQHLLTLQLQHNTQLLQQLQHTNVYDDVFHIGYDGHFGTISGFRLGRLPSQPVDWVETNAALGQVCLCVHTISRLVSHSFARYRLHPMGNFSRVSRLDEPATLYDLYGSGDSWGPKLFWIRKFEVAMLGLLTCIRELGEYAAAKEKGRFAFPHAIRDDRVGELSIKIQFHGDGKWTKAMKYMLIDVKTLLVWCSAYVQRENAQQHAIT